MNFLGYLRPDGSVGIRNYICFLPVDRGSDTICQKITPLIEGAIAIPYCYESNDPDFIAAIAINPNIGAVIIVETEKENLLSKHILKKVRSTGRLAEIINIIDCGGIPASFTKILAKAISIIRDITTYRRELVEIKKLSLGIWLEENFQQNLYPVFKNFCQQLIEHDCCIIGNNGLEKAFADKISSKQDKNYYLNSGNILYSAKSPGFKFTSAKSIEEFTQLAVAHGSQILVLHISKGVISNNIIAPTIKTTSNNDYYKTMEDTVEFYVNLNVPPENISLLLLNEILSTCSGKLTKSEVINDALF
ncbi:MAG: UxaA family hydrolase [Caldisphaera sp.]